MLLLCKNDLDTEYVSMLMSSTWLLWDDRSVTEGDTIFSHDSLIGDIVDDNGITVEHFIGVLVSSSDGWHSDSKLDELETKSRNDNS